MPRLTRARAIRAKCLECCCGNSAEVRDCEIKTCSLWIYRMTYEVDMDGNRRIWSESSASDD